MPREYPCSCVDKAVRQVRNSHNPIRKRQGPDPYVALDFRIACFAAQMGLPEEKSRVSGLSAEKHDGYTMNKSLDQCSKHDPTRNVVVWSSARSVGTCSTSIWIPGLTLLGVKDLMKDLKD